MKNRLGFGSVCARERKEISYNPSHQLPIHATSSFVFDNLQEGIDVFAGRKPGHIYGRFGNPTVDTVAEKIASLEGYGLAEQPVCYLLSSGMAAVSTLAIALLKSGDKILTQGNIYGGTTSLFNQILAPLGIGCELTDLAQLDQVADQLKRDPAIRMIYAETPANPTLACVDLKGLAEVARNAGVWTAVDNTFATPYLQQPFALGIDFIVHSTTKYLNGHANTISGAVLGMDAGLMRTKVYAALKLLGTNANSWDAWLVHNGMKTLALRMERHCDNAQALAEFLERHPKVARVNYLSLPSHPDHELAKRQMRRFGGMLSFELKGGLAAAHAFINRLELCTLAPTLGDVDTLVMHPVSMSHMNVPKEIREAAGITDGLVRISVGIEDAADLIGDVGGALAG